jgi:hypothetical protein
MSWYAVLIPAAFTALAVRLDAVWIGPYWSFMELVPGMGGVDVDFWYEQSQRRWAIVRRYAYVALVPGVGVTVVVDGSTAWDAALVGAVTAGLILWPLLFYGLPLGVMRSDWQLAPLYTGVVISFVAAAATGSMMVDYVREQSRGDVVGWLQEQYVEAIFWPAIWAVAVAVFVGAYRSLRLKKRERDERGYE